MSAVRKHESINQRINEKHERKELKEEQKRLERMQRTADSKKRNKAAYTAPLTDDISAELLNMDFTSLEDRVYAYYADHIAA